MSDTNSYNRYIMLELISDLRWLERKMEFDRESNLTHAQRNWNDDYNRHFLEATRKKMKDLITGDDKTDNIPF